MINHPNVKEMFSIANRILGYDLYSKCADGPIEDLNQTLYAQPAIYVTSLAAVQRLKSENEKVRCIRIDSFTTVRCADSGRGELRGDGRLQSR